MQYVDAKAKRAVQKRLFSKITKCKTFLGLAGPHPEEYRKILPQANNYVLVDFNAVDESIYQNSLIGAFDTLRYHQHCYTMLNVVDCDFCKSIKSDGIDLLYIYTKMKRSNVRNQYITFTFSLRGVGLEATLDWLNDNFNLNIENRTFNKIEGDFGYKKFIHKLYNQDIYMYRDSGDYMISGLLKI